MFGEDYFDESPRAASPWDQFLPPPSTESSSLDTRKKQRNGIPKLVPEVEEVRSTSAASGSFVLIHLHRGTSSTN